MKLIKKKRKTLSNFQEKNQEEGKTLAKDDAAKVKGGTKDVRKAIWNGCGGLTPQ